MPEIVKSPSRLYELEPTHPFFCETRPGSVKRPGFSPTADWAVGPTEYNMVRWLFINKSDADTFKAVNGSAVLLAGRTDRT